MHTETIFGRIQVKENEEVWLAHNCQWVESCPCKGETLQTK